jgi:hypothetical protein
MPSKLFLLIMSFFVLVSFLFVGSVGASSEMWSQTYGGTSDDSASSLVSSSDGGYALAGSTKSFGAGDFDFWLVKTDAYGNMNWNKTYGGSKNDRAYELVETSDGGFAIAGYTYSFGAGESDFWLVKVDSQGNMEWNKTYGGASHDFAYSLVSSSDGGYALAGSTKSFGAGGYDAWLVKTDEYGNVECIQTYGGASHDSALSLIETSDGGYALAGVSNSFGGYWLVKTDAIGNIMWNYTYRSGSEHAYSLVETSDGGYALTGCLPDLGFGAGSFFWLVKTDSDGNMEWIQTYNGGANSIIETSDGGFALSGGNLLVKTDADGNIEWNQTYNGTAHSLVQMPDGGYAIAGTKNDDFWLIKTDEHGVIPEFPSWIILPLFSMTALFAVILKKRIRYRSET